MRFIVAVHRGAPDVTATTPACAHEQQELKPLLLGRVTSSI